MAVSSLSLDNPVFSAFVTYAALVICKTMIMSLVTAYHRISNKLMRLSVFEVINTDKHMGVEDLLRAMPVTLDLLQLAFANEEDVATYKKVEVVRYHPAVERVRRCHQNDLENVIPFVLLGFLYVATGPSLWTALLHFRIFTIARFAHTLIYLNTVPQPARALSFFIGQVVNVSMAVAVLRVGTF